MRMIVHGHDFFNSLKTSLEQVKICVLYLIEAKALLKVYVFRILMFLTLHIFDIFKEILAKF